MDRHPKRHVFKSLSLNGTAHHVGGLRKDDCKD